MVIEHEHPDKLKHHSSVGEAIIMNLGRSRVMTGTSIALEDAPKELSTKQKKRAARREVMGNISMRLMPREDSLFTSSMPMQPR